MEISQEGIALIKKFEGCELEAYKCAAGVWTIGYGSTKGVKENDSISQEDADKLLMDELKEYESYVNDFVEVNLEQNQFDSLCSFCYNLGPQSLKSSTLLKVLNAKDYEGVPAQIKRWNKAGGKVLQGLVRRREAESLLFTDEDWSKV
jgi:lysozyme